MSRLFDIFINGTQKGACIQDAGAFYGERNRQNYLAINSQTALLKATGSSIGRPSISKA